MESLFTETEAFLKVLQEDADGMWNLLMSASSVNQFKRGYIRAQFAALEGALEMLRRYALLKPSKLSLGEQVALHGKAYKVDKSGDVSGTDQFSAFKHLVKFTFKACAKAYELDFQLDYNDEAWNQLTESINVRNRLAHPKALRDMHVTVEEAAKVKVGGLWLMHNVRTLLVGMERAIEKEAEAKTRKSSEFLRLFTAPRLPPLPDENEQERMIQMDEAITGSPLPRPSKLQPAITSPKDQVVADEPAAVESAKE